MAGPLQEGPGLARRWPDRPRARPVLRRARGRDRAPEPRDRARRWRRFRYRADWTGRGRNCAGRDCRPSRPGAPGCGPRAHDDRDCGAPPRRLLRRHRQPIRGQQAVPTGERTGSHPTPCQDRGCARVVLRFDPMMRRAAPINVSVSERGSRTSGVISRSRPQNSRRPRMRHTGSRPSRRAMKPSNTAAAAPSDWSGSRTSAARSMPAEAQSRMRASTSGSAMPASASRRVAVRSASAQRRGPAQAGAAQDEPAARSSTRRSRAAKAGASEGISPSMMRASS